MKQGNQNKTSRSDQSMELIVVTSGTRDQIRVSEWEGKGGVLLAELKKIKRHALALK